MGNMWGGIIGKDYDRERIGRRVRKIVIGKTSIAWRRMGIGGE